MVQLVVRSFLDSGVSVDSIDYPDELLSLRCKDSALQMVYQTEYAIKNRSFSHTKDRGEVSGTTKKMYRQKGTGGARHGSRRVSQFRGGGVTFGPKFALRRIKINKNLRLLAVLTALNKHIERGSLIVLDAIYAKSYKTKDLSVNIAILYKSCFFQESKNHNDFSNIASLFIGNFFSNDSVELKNFLLASRNIIGLSFTHSDALNIFHLMNNKVLFVAKDALINLIEKFQSKLLNGKELKVSIG